MQYAQSVNTPPTARGDSRSDILEAAYARAEFWGYLPNGKTVQVRKDTAGSFAIK